MSGTGPLVSTSLAWVLKYLKKATMAWGDNLMIPTADLIGCIHLLIIDLCNILVSVQLDDIIQKLSEMH